MMMFILIALAIICLYKAVDHLISDVYQYKYAGMLAHVLQDADTNRLFVYLKPYMTDYINLIRNESENYAKSVNFYHEYLKSLQGSDAKKNESK